MWRKKGREKEERNRRGGEEEGEGGEDKSNTTNLVFSAPFLLRRNLFLNVEKPQGSHLTPRVTWVHFRIFLLLIAHTQHHKEGKLHLVRKKASSSETILPTLSNKDPAAAILPTLDSSAHLSHDLVSRSL